jgi:hypothetical protein
VRVVDEWVMGTGLHDELVSGVERAVFGPVGRDDMDIWVGNHVRARLGVARFASPTYTLRNSCVRTGFGRPPTR